MFWFGRPPLLRRVGAVLLILGAGIIEFWPTSTVQYPFAAVETAAGASLQVEWREVPAGLLEPPALSGMVASHRIARGDPITPSDVRRPLGIPHGWWALTVEVPSALEPGAETRLVLDSGRPVAGIVVATNEPGPFAASGLTALVAVPGEDAARVAAAVAARQVVVLIAP